VRQLERLPSRVIKLAGQTPGIGVICTDLQINVDILKNLEIFGDIE